MAYVARVSLIVNTDNGGEVQDVEATGDTRNEALENLQNACAGVNVLGAIMSTLQTAKVS